jgi:hypothetical protein
MSTRRRSSVLNYVKDSILKTLRYTRKVRSPVTSYTSSTRRAKSRLSQTSRIRTKEVTPSPIRKGVAIIKPLLAKSRIARTLKRKFKQSKLSKFLNDDPTCAICLENIEDINEGIRTSCNHVFHRTCLAEWLAKSVSQNSCPACRSTITKLSNLIESGLSLSQIVELRADTQNITHAMSAILLTQLHKSHKTLKTHIEIIKWICNNRPQLQGEITANLCQQIIQLEEIDSLIQKTIVLFIDVFPNTNQLFQDLISSDDIYELERLDMRLKNMTKNNIIAEFLQSYRANGKVYTELTENEHIKLFMNVASLYINNQLSA